MSIKEAREYDKLRYKDTRGRKSAPVFNPTCLQPKKYKASEVRSNWRTGLDKNLSNRRL